MHELISSCKMISLLRSQVTDFTTTCERKRLLRSQVTAFTPTCEWKRLLRSQVTAFTSTCERKRLLRSQVTDFTTTCEWKRLLRSQVTDFTTTCEWKLTREGKFRYSNRLALCFRLSSLTDRERKIAFSFVFGHGGSSRSLRCFLSLSCISSNNIISLSLDI